MNAPPLLLAGTSHGQRSGQEILRSNAQLGYRDRVELGSIQTADFRRTFGPGWDQNLPYEACPVARIATDIWCYLIVSYQPIRIHFECAAIGDSNKIASTGTYFTTYSGWRYPLVLAEALAGRQFNSEDSADIKITLNIRPNTQWYFGTDGLAPGGQIDFLTTLLHEITHGLGFTHSFKADSVTGYGWRYVRNPNVKYDNLCTYGPMYPSLPDSVLTSSVFGDSSLTLGSALKSRNIYFRGQRTFAMRENPRDTIARLFAPSSFKPGSSISHLDSNMFHVGNRNSLMTPSKKYAEATHSPGELGLAILRDVGWPIKRLN